MRRPHVSSAARPGAASGTQAQFDQSFFQNLAIHVVTPGIDARRKQIKVEIDGRQDLPISDYDIRAALQDAIRYHNACSLNAGLEAAADSIKEVKDIGLSRALSVTSKVLALRRQLDLNSELTEGSESLLSALPTAVLSSVSEEVAEAAQQLESRITALRDAGADEGELTQIAAALQEAVNGVTEILEGAKSNASSLSEAVLKSFGKIAAVGQPDKVAKQVALLRADRLRAKALSQDLRNAGNEFSRAERVIEDRIERLSETVRTALLERLAAQNLSVQTTLNAARQALASATGSSIDSNLGRDAFLELLRSRSMDWDTDTLKSVRIALDRLFPPLPVPAPVPAVPQAPVESAPLPDGDGSTPPPQPEPTPRADE